MKIFRIFSYPKSTVAFMIMERYLSFIFPDKIYLKILSWLKFQESFKLNTPTTFNEKLNWLKLHDRKDIYTSMVDKLSAKKYVANIIGDEYIVPLYATFDSVEEIAPNALPDNCVLKSNQDSGGAIIWKKGNGISWNMVVEKLKRRKKNHWRRYREWPYKNIRTRFFAEKLLENGIDNSIIYDYKFWCFNGMPQIMYITFKGKNYFENFYDMEFNPIMITHGAPRRIPEFEKPEQFELMVELSKKLSKDIPFVRVDFFLVQDHVYFGEFTFYDWAGLKPFGEDWDKILGNLIMLPKKN